MYRLTKNQIENIVRRGSVALYEYCKKHNIHHVVLGVSGGLDSAVTMGFAKKACEIAETNDFSLTAVGLIMPCKSNPRDEMLAKEVIKVFDAEEIKIDLCFAFDKIMNEGVYPILDSAIISILKKNNSEEEINGWSWSGKIAQGNIKARLRMITLYHVARMLKGMVLSTDNYSEWWMGFWTICGDVGDFCVIQKILKGLELYDIAEYLGVPKEIIQSKPGDGLGIAGNAEDQIGASYQIVDKIMVQLIQKRFDINGSFNQLSLLPKIKGIDPSVVRRVAHKCLANSFKRKGTVIISRRKLGLLPIREIKL